MDGTIHAAIPGKVHALRIEVRAKVSNGDGRITANDGRARFLGTRINRPLLLRVVASESVLRARMEAVLRRAINVAQITRIAMGSA